jgi:hypothetical protein
MSFYPTQGPIKADIDFTSTNEQLRRIEIELDRLNDQIDKMLELFKHIDEIICNLASGVDK